MQVTGEITALGAVDLMLNENNTYSLVFDGGSGVLSVSHWSGMPVFQVGEQWYGYSELIRHDGPLYQGWISEQDSRDHLDSYYLQNPESPWSSIWKLIVGIDISTITITEEQAINLFGYSGAWKTTRWQAQVVYREATAVHETSEVLRICAPKGPSMKFASDASLQGWGALVLGRHEAEKARAMSLGIDEKTAYAIGKINSLLDYAEKYRKSKPDVDKRIAWWESLLYGG